MTRPDSAFFTTVCFSLKQVWDDTIRTACTDGLTIKFSPAFFMSLSIDEQLFLMLHETLHVAYLHPARLMGRDPQKANKAMDYVINLQLVERGFKMPLGGLLDHAYAGMSWEEVYALLPDDPPDTYDMDVQPGNGKETPAELEEAVQDILVRAAMQSRMSGDKPGSIPGDIQVILDKLLNPKLSWNKILLKYLHSRAKDDYSWRKFNRRFFPTWMLPSLYSERLKNLTIAVDISGSVSDDDFKAFVSEIASIFRMMKPELITVLQFDTVLHSVDTVKSIPELMAIKFTGRGGTLISPVLTWCNENKPELLLVFTDGGFCFSDQVTKTETIWLIHNDKGEQFKAPFGKVIHYQLP